MQKQLKNEHFVAQYENGEFKVRGFARVEIDSDPELNKMVQFNGTLSSTTIQKALDVLTEVINGIKTQEGIE